ncbi:MAG: DUF1294 domain-containing protein [Opitutales bacterium]
MKTVKGGRGNAKPSPTGQPAARPLTTKLWLMWLALIAFSAVAVINQLGLTVLASVAASVSLGLSLLGFGLVRWDKRQAQRGSWRTPEMTLHLIEMFGGWPGSLLARWRYRHKTAKAAYRTVFWAIVGIYQLLALDSIRGWAWLGRLGYAG